MHLLSGVENKQNRKPCSRRLFPIAASSSPSKLPITISSLYFSTPLFNNNSHNNYSLIMAEKIHPSAKQSAGIPTVTGNHNPNPNPNPNPNFPATKPRPLYRPQPRRNRRSCCCRVCLWTTFIIILLIILAAVAGGVFYVLYRPHRPSFTVTSLHVTQFNLTSSNQLNTKFNFTVTARNPNKKIEFGFNPVSVSIHSKGVNVGDGSIPAFVMKHKNTTVLKAVVSTSGKTVNDNNNNNNNNNNNDNINSLKTDLKNKKSLPLIIKLDTKVNVKIGSLKTKKVPIRVVCDGIRFTPPVGKAATTASTSDVKCKVDLRIKIWKWTV